MSDHRSSASRCRRDLRRARAQHEAQLASLCAQVREIIWGNKFNCYLANCVSRVKYFFCVIPDARPLAHTIPHGPFQGGGGDPWRIFATRRRGMGVFGLQTLAGRHRDLNFGPPACESGVVAITLRGQPFLFVKLLMVNVSHFLPCLDDEPRVRPPP